LVRKEKPQRKVDTRLIKWAERAKVDEKTYFVCRHCGAIFLVTKNNIIKTFYAHVPAGSVEWEMLDVLFGD